MLRIEQVKVINFLDVIDTLEKQGVDREVVWDEIRGHWHGNQQFHNDSLFRYVLPSLNGEELNELETAIADVCKEVIKNDTIIFDISW